MDDEENQFKTDGSKNLSQLKNLPVWYTSTQAHVSMPFDTIKAHSTKIWVKSALDNSEKILLSRLCMSLHWRCLFVNCRQSKFALLHLFYGNQKSFQHHRIP